LAQGDNIWNHATVYRLGNLLKLDGNASGCGVGSVLRYLDKLFLFYGSEERHGANVVSGSVINPIDRVVNCYQTVIPLKLNSGVIDARTKLVSDRSANNPMMRISGGMGWKAKEGTWVWSKAGVLSPYYAAARSNAFGSFIFDLGGNGGGVAVSTAGTNAGFHVFNSFGNNLPSGMFVSDGGNIRFQVDGVACLRWLNSTQSFQSEADDAADLGSVSRRWSTVWAVNGTIQSSDERSKTDIEETALGLDFINSLSPVSYKWAVGGNNVVRQVYRDADGNEVDASTDGAIHAELITEPVAGTRTHHGLIAQQVKEALPDGVDFGGWVLTDKDDPESQQALRYDQFIAPLIKAVKELSAKVAALEQQLAQP
jgi:hypothetical protein